MIKKLAAKAQKINSALDPNLNSFASTVIIEPEDAILKEKKGTVYGIFKILGTDSFDVGLITRVVHDVLQNSYYQSDNVSPVQALEKAIVEVRDSVTKLSNESIRASAPRVDFDMLCGVLWGNVMYVVSYGKMGSYLTRDGTVKPINADSEGSFSAATGIVRDGDVIVFCTKPFESKITPEDLLNSTVSITGLTPDACALLLKIEVLVNFSSNEVVDIRPVETGTSIGKKLSKVREAIVDQFKNLIVKASTKSPDKSSLFSLKIKSEESENRKNKKITSIIVLAALLLVGSLTLSFSKKTQITSVVQPVENTEVLSESTSPEEPVEDDPAYKITRVAPEVLYDLKLMDGIETSSLNLSYVELSDGDLLIGDYGMSKVFVSKNASEKFETSDLAPKPQTVSANYLGNKYIVDGDKINKITSDGTESLWTENSILESAKSMAIDSNIFVLLSDGGIAKFLKGEKVAFTVSGLDRPFSGATQLITSYDFDNIYITDAGNQRIVVLDKTGALVAQYLTKDAGIWGDLKSIAVSSDESKLFVLAGTKVFSVVLTK